MKITLIYLFAVAAVCTSTAIPQIPLDNSHYVEGVSRYIWMPDGDGVPHLVDLEEKEDVSRMSRNGANNAYWLFTRSNRNNQQVLVHNNANSIRNSFYNANRQTKVIVHGWNSNGNSAINPMITSAFLDVADVNVIVVDWRGAASGAYTTSVWAVPSVGQHLGHFLQFVINTVGGNWNNFHLVGFSLGAHIVGNAGRTVGGRARRVTGLDPAGPQWGGNSLALNNRDGVYVEAIHTDGGLIGIFDPIAHADFYPNGGRNAQPGCIISNCSHSRAYELFASSVRTDHFVGRLCNNLNEARNVRCAGASFRMGNRDLNKRGFGLYGLTTGNRWPF